MQMFRSDKWSCESLASVHAAHEPVIQHILELKPQICSKDAGEEAEIARSRRRRAIRILGGGRRRRRRHHPRRRDGRRGSSEVAIAERLVPEEVRLLRVRVVRLRQPGGVLARWVPVRRGDGGEVGVQLRGRIGAGRDGHGVVQRGLDRRALGGGFVPEARAQVLADSCVRLDMGWVSGGTGSVWWAYDHAGQVVAAVVVWSRPYGLQWLHSDISTCLTDTQTGSHLFSVRIDLVHVLRVEVCSRGIERAGLVAGYNLYSSKLIIVESSVVANTAS